ncbi:MAG: SDR family NAD(P)-dependent oxidoreductase [Actinomycetota bacterium]|nr:SDR family oxidoreductase [Actinomycetota bacterium]
MSVALITGGSRGFGRALARELAVQGWTLILDARGDHDLAAVAAELGAVGIAGDVADAAHRSALATAVASAGRLDVLVNNASDLGVSPLPPLARYPLDTLEDVFRTNVVAPLALTQRVLPFLETTGGTVVNVTSDASVEAYPGWGAYGASKAALDQMSGVLAAENPALRVYAFDPGDMRTAMHQQAFPGEDISDRPEPESVVPALLRLLVNRPQSGRYRATDVLVPGGVR